MKFFCNLASSEGFSTDPEVDFDEPPVVGKIIEYDGERWKIVGVHRDSVPEIWLRKVVNLTTK